MFAKPGDAGPGAGPFEGRPAGRFLVQKLDENLRLGRVVTAGRHAMMLVGNRSG